MRPMDVNRLPEWATEATDRPVSRVLVVDDDQDMVDLLVHVLEADGHECSYQLSGEGVDEVVARESPDLVILDVVLPGLGGHEICRRIRRFSEVPIIFLTVRAEIADEVVGLTSGADDYMVKPFAASVLTTRVRTLLRRTQPDRFDRRHIRFGELAVDPRSEAVVVSGRPVDLSRTEFRLLASLIDHKGSIVSKDELLSTGWGDRAGGDHVVEVSMSRLRDKLVRAGVSRNLISTHRGRGYRLNDR